MLPSTWELQPVKLPWYYNIKTTTSAFLGEMSDKNTSYINSCIKSKTASIIYRLQITIYTCICTCHLQPSQNLFATSQKLSKKLYGPLDFNISMTTFTLWVGNIFLQYS